MAQKVYFGPARTGLIAAGVSRGAVDALETGINRLYDNEVATEAAQAAADAAQATADAAGTGTVTSVAVGSTDGSVSFTGSPITTSGTFNLGVVKAPKLSTARNIAITGDGAWNVNFDGSTAATAAITVTKTSGVAFGSFATGTDAANLTGTVSVNRFNSGTSASSSTFLRGDGTWASPGGSGTVTTSGSPASGNLAKFSGSAAITNGDLSGDLTTSGTLAATLATVNSNVGTFGDATHVAQVTVNAKGLITAASSVAITGSGGTPGGSSGDIQYNNAGAFGGFTMSGDVTVVPSTGVATIGALKIATGMIQASAVTLAKIANAAASSKLLGSGASGSGSAYAELTLGTSLSFSSTTLNAGGTLIGVRTITATGSGTYTPTTGTVSIVVELQGGGGGGGALASATAGNVSLALGGQGGGWLRKRLTTNFSGAGYVVGAKGNGGAAGANDGAAGSDTTFTDTAGSPTTYTAKGGLGGTRLGPFGPPFQWNIPPVTATTGGDVNRSGGSSTVAFTLGTANGSSGMGGASMYSAGAASVGLSGSSTSAAGLSAGGNGGGGSGAILSGTASAAAGGNGSDGVIIIWEYS